MTENGIKAVESTPAGQRMLSSIQEGKERNNQPDTVVRDVIDSEKFGDGSFQFADGLTQSSVPGEGETFVKVEKGARRASR